MTAQIDPEKIESKLLNKYADFGGKRVLEVGCGDGRLTWRYARLSRSVVGIDLDADELRLAMIDRPAALESALSFSRANSIHLPFASEKFDIAILAWSL